MKRRSLILLSLSPFVSCATPLTVSQGASDAKLISQALSAIYPQISPLILNADLAGKAQAALSVITAASSAIANQKGDNAAPLVQQIISAVQALAGVVLPLVNLPPAFVPVIQAALALLPSLAASAGLALDEPTVEALPPQGARLILTAAIHG